MSTLHCESLCTCVVDAVPHYLDSLFRTEITTPHLQLPHLHSSRTVALGVKLLLLQRLRPHPEGSLHPIFDWWAVQSHTPWPQFWTALRGHPRSRAPTRGLCCNYITVYLLPLPTPVSSLPSPVLYLRTLRRKLPAGKFWSQSLFPGDPNPRQHVS